MKTENLHSFVDMILARLLLTTQFEVIRSYDLLVTEQQIAL